MTKECNRCKRIKPVGDFHFAKSNVGGLKHQCKECVKEINKIREALPKDPEKERIKAIKLAEKQAKFAVLESKKCQKCEIDQPIELFNRDKSSRDGYQYTCKPCEKQWRKENSETEKARSRAYYLNHKAESKAAGKRWVKENWATVYKTNRAWLANNREAARESLKLYRQKNREKINENNNRTSRQLRKTSRNHNLRLRLRSALRRVVMGAAKVESAVDLVGCTQDALIQHIEKGFTEGMTWEVFLTGDRRIHLDHIIPLCAFDMENFENQKMCFHYSNLRPLWDVDNMAKLTRDLAFRDKMNELRARRRMELFDVKVIRSF